MEITWYGHSCFRITERNMATVVTDPYDHRINGYEPLHLKAEIVTISHDSPAHNHLSAVKGNVFAITGPGEYEIGGVFITGLQTNQHTKKTEDEFRNTMYVIDYNGVTLVHLGNINRVPTQTEVEEMGEVNIALVPVGGGDSLNAAKAAEMISLLEPNIVIPMHYGIPKINTELQPLSKFLKEIGLDNPEVAPSLKINGPSNLPEETRINVLEYQTH
jgi:L-ascorbate metabolism protein UlaG (beta-lactamase superfamily)